MNINTTNVLNLGYFKSKLVTDIKIKNHFINFIYSNLNVYNYKYNIMDSDNILD
jgi:hypothetical protein